MWKAVLAGTTALAIAGTSLVYAQKSSDDFQRTERWRPGAADIAAFGDARIAALHAGLKLTADQEKLWPPVEAALRDLAKQRSERHGRHHTVGLNTRAIFDSNAAATGP